MNEKALTAFMKEIDRAEEYMAIVKARLNDHLDAEPDKVHWGHVGDAHHVAEVMRDIARFVDWRPEG